MKFGDNSSNTTACLILFNMGHVCMHLSVQNVWGLTFFLDTLYNSCRKWVDLGSWLGLVRAWSRGRSSRRSCRSCWRNTAHNLHSSRHTRPHLQSRAYHRNTHLNRAPTRRHYEHNDWQFASSKDRRRTRKQRTTYTCEWLSRGGSRPKYWGAGPSSSLPLLF